MSHQNIPEPTAADEAKRDTWRRVHPLSPLFRGGWMVLVVLWIIISNLREFSIDFVVGLAQDDAGTARWMTLGIIVVLLAAVALWGYMAWRFYEFRVTDDAIEIRSGWIFRQQRRMRLDRMQAVDIEQPFLARLLGFSTLKLEAADGGDSAMQLQYLKKADAESLRRELLRASSGARPSAPSAPSGQPDQPSATTPFDDEQLTPMLRIPTGRLIGMAMLNVLVVVLWTVAIYVVVILGAFLFGGVVSEDGALVAGLAATAGFGFFLLISAPIVIVGTAVGTVVPNYGFTVNYTPNGLKNVYGLTTKNTQTIPPGRVQAVQINRPFMWRLLGWASVQITTAGYGEEDSTKSTVLPVGTMEDVFRILSIVTPDPGIPNGAEIIDAGLTEDRGSQVGYISSPRRARIFMPLQVRRHGFFITPTLLIMRSGRLARHVTLLPHDRIQSSSLDQGPLARARRVASVHFHTSSGPVNTRLRNQDLDTVTALFGYEAYISGFARRISRRDAWMQSDELARFNDATVEAKETLEQTQDDQQQAGVSR